MSSTTGTTGDSFTWVGPVSGDWNVASNWQDVTADGAAVVAPGSLDSVTFNSPSNLYQVISGLGDAASLTLNGDNVVAGQLNVGTVTSSGALEINAGASLLAGAASLGTGGLGTVSVSGMGAMLAVSGTLNTMSGLAISNHATVEAGALVLSSMMWGTSVDATSVIEVGSAGSAAAGALTVDSGATLAATTYETLNGNVVDNGMLSISATGSLYFNAASLNINGTLSGSGQVAIGAGASLTVGSSAYVMPGSAAPAGVAAGSLTLSLGAKASLGLSGAVAAGNTISFAGAGGALTLNAVQSFDPTTFTYTSSFQDAATITGFDNTDVILLQGGTVTSAAYAAGSTPGSGSLTLFDGTTSLGTLSLAGTYTGDTFLVTPINSGNPGGLLNGTENQISLFLGGVFVQGNAITVTPNAGEVVSLNQLANDPYLFPTGTIQTLILDGPGTAVVSGNITINDLQVPTGGQLILNGATVVTDPVSVDANGNIAGYGTLIGDLANSGLITASNGPLVVAGNISGTGTLAIAAGATLELKGSVATSETVSFSASGAGTLVLDNPATFNATVTNFATGDEIVVDTPAPATFSQAGSIVSVIENNATLGTLTFESEQQAQSAISTTNALVDHALCFLAGTLLEVPSGQAPVEDLKVGDLVMTVSGKARPIRWIGVGRVLATRGRRSAATPVIVRKGAIGPNIPNRDLHVTKGHALYLDGVLIPVEFLVNHRSILWNDRAQEVCIYHVELDTHDILVANGAPAESYRDDGNRWLFQNGNSGWNQPAKPPCAPVLTGGEIVDQVWRRLLDRAGPRPGLPLTHDPDLHLIVGSKRVDAVMRKNGVYIFNIDGQPSEARVVSRAASPQELGVARDPRILGVAVRQICTRQGTRFDIIEPNDPTLVDGFHAFEPDNGLRWTDGDASLPIDRINRFSGARQLVLHLGGQTHYLDDRRRVA